MRARREYSQNSKKKTATCRLSKRNKQTAQKATGNSRSIPLDTDHPLPLSLSLSLWNLSETPSKNLEIEMESCLPDLLREFQKIRGGEDGEKPSISFSSAFPCFTPIESITKKQVINKESKKKKKGEKRRRLET